MSPERGGDQAAPTKPTGFRPDIEGLRAIAVGSVLLYHAGLAWVPGGFAGVDIFFVISGFLITTLLVREKRSTGRVDLIGFWTRRARRLLPALVVVVPVAILIARTVETDLLVGIRRQAVGALTFSTNWLEIAHGSNYFAATSPQLFMNFWSLAVEEQFYLFWPLVTLVLLALHRYLAVTEGALAALVLVTFGLSQPQAAHAASDGSAALLWNFQLRKTVEKNTRDLRLSEAKLTALIENTSAAIWSIDRELRYVTFNSHFKRQAEEVAGRPPERPGCDSSPVGSSTPRRSSTRWRLVAVTS